MEEYTLVTGATSDIGKQICRTLINDGHKILLTDYSADALADLASELGENSIYIPLDLSDVESSQQNLINYIRENNINIDCAVFAAGVFSVKPVKALTYEYVKKSFDISLFSIIFISQVLASKKYNGQYLKSVVFVSSVSALMGTKGYVTYGAIKSAMLGLMKSLASELSPRVRVNSVLPGGIKTKATRFLYQDEESTNTRYILGEGFPSDIANAISFLLSEKARWITAQTLVVDGGFMNN
jgi:NAD(P)-dependent dehydrogenase (short-subunit alcohol dehydrogenase family)